MNQLKRRSSLQGKGFSYDKAYVAPSVWDSVVGHWDSMDCKIAVKVCFSLQRQSLCTNLELKLSLRRCLARQTHARRMYNP
jgi:hypothetical protein